MASEKLTDKQERFVQELLKGKSQREAYKAAGYKCDKMTGPMIDTQACNLLKTPKVSLRYNDILTKVRNEAEKRGVMSAVEVLEELSSIGRAKAVDFICEVMEDWTKQAQEYEKSMEKAKIKNFYTMVIWRNSLD